MEIRNNMIDFEKVLILYEQAVHRIENDNRLTQYKWSSVAGFASGFKHLLTEAGLENIIVEGYKEKDANKKLVDFNHVWNIVKINDCWYHIDVCCTDISRYTYFLVSDNVLKNAGYMWNAENPATPEISFGNTDERRKGRFIPKDNSIYYYDKTTNKIIKFNTKTEETAITASGGFGIFEICGDYLYYMGVLYNLTNGIKIECPVGKLLGIVRDTAFFAEQSLVYADDGYATDCVRLNVFDIRTKGVQKTQALILNGYFNVFHLTKLCNLKAFFSDEHDLYCYDLSENTFIRVNSLDKT